MLPGQEVEGSQKRTLLTEKSSIIQEFQYLACETSDGMIYKVQAADNNFLQANFGTGLFISGETNLLFNNGAVLDTDSTEILSEDPPRLVKKAWSGTRRNLIEPFTTRNRTVLVVRVHASDATTSFSEEDLRNSVFGTQGDLVNLKSQFAACSHNKLQFIETPNRTGEETNIVNSVVTITVSEATSVGGVAMRNAVTAALNSQFDVQNPNQLADHVMYCLPSDAMINIAFTSDQSWNTVYKDRWFTYVSVQMHGTFRLQVVH